MTKEKRDAANARLIHMFRHIPAIAALTADRDKWRNRCERLIGYYDNVMLYQFVGGEVFAQTIQKEIDDDTTR